MDPWGRERALSLALHAHWHIFITKSDVLAARRMLKNVKVPGLAISVPRTMRRAIPLQRALCSKCNSIQI